MLRLLALGSVSLALVGCGCASSPSTPSTPTPGPSTDPGTGGGTTVDPPAPFDVTQLGAPCGDGGTCGGGATCARYYGIAGPSGPEFSSCEITCDAKGGCPEGASCVTVADGPGQVCRATPTAE